MLYFSIGLVFVVERLGSVLQLAMSLSSASMGPLTGMFFMGLFLPMIDGVVSIFYASILYKINTIVELIIYT